MDDVKAKKKKPFSATQYSSKYLKKQGYEVEKTEQTVRWPNPIVPGTFKIVKRDLFNAVDLIAIKAKDIPIWVQTTTTAHQADRIQKLAGNKFVMVMLRAGSYHRIVKHMQKVEGNVTYAESEFIPAIRVHVHGWAKKGPRGGAKFWQVTVTQLGLDEDGFLTTKILETKVVDDHQTGIDFDKPEDDF